MGEDVVNPPLFLKINYMRKFNLRETDNYHQIITYTHRHSSLRDKLVYMELQRQIAADMLLKSLTKGQIYKLTASRKLDPEQVNLSNIFIVVMFKQQLFTTKQRLFFRALAKAESLVAFEIARKIG